MKFRSQPRLKQFMRPLESRLAGERAECGEGREIAVITAAEIRQLPGTLRPLGDRQGGGRLRGTKRVDDHELKLTTVRCDSHQGR
jgi:hypothetical protein